MGEDKQKIFYRIISESTGYPLQRLSNDLSILDDIRIAGYDGYELLEDLSREFDFDWSECDIYFYFGPDSMMPSLDEIWHFLNGGFFRDWRSGKLKADRQKVRNLTVGHLWQVCERGKWFDPE